jgi:negative regulator of flagellin synthesis FlgM
MNIQKTLAFLKNVADSVTPAAARESRPASAATAPAVPARPASPAPVLSTQSDFDSARVARIRGEISAGRYQVNTGKIADGLLDTVRDLLAKETQQ